MNLGKLGQALTAREIFDLIQDDLEQVEKKITAESVASVDAVTAIGQYLQSAGGKRLRPALLLLSAKLVGNGGPSAIQLGAVVEMIHAATLVHDDVIDARNAPRSCPGSGCRAWRTVPSRTSRACTRRGRRRRRTRGREGRRSLRRRSGRGLA